MINYMIDSENVGTTWIPYLKENIKKLEKEMKAAARDLQFERAAQLRDKIFEYKVRL